MNPTEEISLPTNKALPPLRQDELNEFSTRMDHITAAPPDEDLVKYWIIWVVLAFACGIFSLLVCMSIVFNRKVRSKPFNLYLIYLMIPDFVFSILCGLTCLLNAINGAYFSHAMCNFQQFYVVFGIGANAWLNSIIAHQLHLILRHSSTRRRYKLPTRKTVTIHAMIVYAWCLFLGSWGYNESKRFPFESGQASGLACLPLEGRTKGSVTFFWACFFPLFVGIPIFYVLWICWDIYIRGLMPPPGQRRLFTIYFGRLIIVFLVMWIPTLLLMFIFSEWMPYWVDFFGGSWSHFQGGLSALLVLLKPDIKYAFRRFISCRCAEKDDAFSESSTRPSSSRALSSGRRSSYWWPREHSVDLPRRSSSIGGSSQDLQDGLPSEYDIEADMSSSQKLDTQSFRAKTLTTDSSISGAKEESLHELGEMGDHVIPIKDGSTSRESGEMRDHVIPIVQDESSCELSRELGDHVIPIKD